MSKLLQTYIPACDAVVKLLWPHAEAVIHDLETGKIFYISNAYSKRRAGESSLNDPAHVFDSDQNVIGPYSKTNWDGHRLKSVTSLIRDGRGRAVGLFCINYDIEAFSGVVDQLRNLFELPPSAPSQSPLLNKDWHETINSEIAAFLKWRKISLVGLTNGETDDLISTLSEKGIFEIRNAVPYVAEILKVSRATIYNRLNAKKLKTRKSHVKNGEPL